MADEKHDELALTKEWQAEARKQTLETLPAFLAKLSGFKHDYGTICRAIAAAAVGAAWAVERGPGGGITGFQAGCVTWDFLEHWGHIEGPAAITRYEDMLYPQSADKFSTISTETWEHLQKKARELITEKSGGVMGHTVHPTVAAHWQSIADGKVPFGYSVRT